MEYTTQNLPDNILHMFLVTRSLKGEKLKEHRASLKGNFSNQGLFSSHGEDSFCIPDLKVEDIAVDKVAWLTESYKDMGIESSDIILDSANLNESLGLIVPRKDKVKSEKIARTKKKSEVFTPSWICNLQNNLYTDRILYKNAFNVTEGDVVDTHKWTPTSGRIKFNSTKDAIDFIGGTVLEMTCGEAPYLVSRYDTVSGENIPVRDSKGRFARIGLLDRKMRVVYETVCDCDNDFETWIKLATLAIKSTYGYEWQGDSLFLARINILNTFIDFYDDFIENSGAQPLTSEEYAKLIENVAEIISWNIWQMDGLTGCLPLSGSGKKVKAAANKVQKYWGVDGDAAVISMGDKILLFEDILFKNSYKSQLGKDANG